MLPFWQKKNNAAGETKIGHKSVCKEKMLVGCHVQGMACPTTDDGNQKLAKKSLWTKGTLKAKACSPMHPRAFRHIVSKGQFNISLAQWEAKQIGCGLSGFVESRKGPRAAYSEEIKTKKMANNIIIC